jgi:hypothetical protein
MANDIQSVSVKTITTSPTTISNLNTFSVLNSSADPLSISTDGGTSSVTLTTGQTLTISASSGFTLPPVTLTGTSMSAQVITT